MEAPPLPSSPPLRWSRWEPFVDGDERLWLSACFETPWRHGYVPELAEVLEGRVLPIVRSAATTIAPGAGALVRVRGRGRRAGLVADYAWSGAVAGALRLWITVGGDQVETCLAACASGARDPQSCAHAAGAVELEEPPTAPPPSAPLRWVAAAVHRPREAASAGLALAALVAWASIAGRRRPRRGVG